MTRLSFRPLLTIVLLGAVSLSLSGCGHALEQESQTVRVSPVSDEYKLAQRLEGRVYILLAETSTGQEQHRSTVSDSLARALRENWKELQREKGHIELPFLGSDSKLYEQVICSDGLEVLSFTDLINRLNEKDLCQRHAEMMKFYQENGMFRKSDLQFLAGEIGADYIVLPCLLDIKRWSNGRLSVFGTKFLNTHIVSGMMGMEIWDTRSGRKVFSATSDITMASEKIKEEPMSMEEAFQKAWFGIMRQVPGHSTVNPPVIEAQGPAAPDKDKHVDSQDLNTGGGTKAG
jgi:hypothetical protein